MHIDKIMLETENINRMGRIIKKNLKQAWMALSGLFGKFGGKKIYHFSVGEQNTYRLEAGLANDLPILSQPQ